MSNINVNGVSFSDAEIKELKQGGTSNKVLTNTKEGVKTGPAVNVVATDEYFDSAWGQSPKINSGKKVSKPRVRGQEKASIVRAPDTRRFAKLDADRKLEELAASDKKEAEIAAMSPSALRATVNALDRRLRRVEKELKAQKDA